MLSSSSAGRSNRGIRKAPIIVFTTLLACFLVALYALRPEPEAAALSTWARSSIKQGAQWALESVNEPDNALAYRRHLESHAAGYNYTLGSSRTSTFDSINVLSLAASTERQEQMHQIADALGLRFDIFPATSKTSPLIGWIAERVKEIRDVKKPILAAYLKKPQAEVGGMTMGSPWQMEAEPITSGLIFPNLTATDSRWKVNGKVVTWTDYLALPQIRNSLKPSVANLNVTELLLDPAEKSAWRQLTPPYLASWYSHTHMWRRMLVRGDKTALFLEDDVDFEFDFERQWVNALRVLPADWDMVYLGHCWARTKSKPQYLNPIVREAAEPRCLHGYALSASGAARLLKLVENPWIAYQAGIDLIIPKFIIDNRTKAFVLEPPLVIQAKGMASTIQSAGAQNWWRCSMQDSTLERIRRDQGLDVKPLSWEDMKDDPCIYNS